MGRPRRKSYVDMMKPTFYSLELKESLVRNYKDYVKSEMAFLVIFLAKCEQAGIEEKAINYCMENILQRNKTFSLSYLKSEIAKTTGVAI